MKLSQESLYDQLLQVRALANKNGYYDAADFITERLENMPKSLTKANSYYIQFENETVEEAIESQNGIGFKTIEDAKGEAEALEAGVKTNFSVLDSKLNVVFKGITSGE